MDQKKDDNLCIDIRKKLDNHSARLSNCCIFRAPRFLRSVNEEAYEPQIVAIGPYHCHKNHLKRMEEHKLHFLKMLLQRKGEDNLERYMDAMRSMEERARSFYLLDAEDPSGSQTEEFVKMMLLDSCFICEVIRPLLTENNNPTEGSTNTNNTIFEAPCIDNAVFRDLLLFENQLPLFVLLEFFEMTKMPGEDSRVFVKMISKLLPIRNILNSKAPANHESILNCWHLPGLLQSSWHLLGLLHNVCLPTSQKFDKEWKFIPSATRLEEAGIKFKKVETERTDNISLFDIKFENAVLKLPILTVDDRTECFFRNLIAYEQFCPCQISYVADYVAFMDCLINSREDVELLFKHGIIDNWLGDEKVVAGMFNKLRDNVTCDDSKFYYSKLFKEINYYCTRPCNRSMADLRHNYFNTPWAFISLLAAILLLLLALAQTVFSVLAYFNQ